MNDEISILNPSNENKISMAPTKQTSYLSLGSSSSNENSDIKTILDTKLRGIT